MLLYLKKKNWSKGGKNLIFFFAFLLKYRPLPSGGAACKDEDVNSVERIERGARAAAAPAEETF